MQNNKQPLEKSRGCFTVLKSTTHMVSVSFWLRGQGAGVRWTPLREVQKHRPRRQPRP